MYEYNVGTRVRVKCLFYFYGEQISAHGVKLHHLFCGTVIRLLQRKLTVACLNTCSALLLRLLANGETEILPDKRTDKRDKLAVRPSYV